MGSKRKPKITLPDVDIFAPAYVAESKCKDRCSCSPDSIHGVYFGMACRRHDDDYKFIADHAEELSYWQRLKLKWAADQRLHDGIKEAFRRSSLMWGGWDGEIVANVYKGIVVRCNWAFRLWKAVTLRSI